MGLAAFQERPTSAKNQPTTKLPGWWGKKKCGAVRVQPSASLTDPKHWGLQTHAAPKPLLDVGTHLALALCPRETPFPRQLVLQVCAEPGGAETHIFQHKLSKAREGRGAGSWWGQHTLLLPWGWSAVGIAVPSQPQRFSTPSGIQKGFFGQNPDVFAAHVSAPSHLALLACYN